MTKSNRKMLSILGQLLSCSSRNCLTCGRVIHTQNRKYPELCFNCYRFIPWITRIRCGKCGRHIGCPDCTRDKGIKRDFIMNRSAVEYNPQMREWLGQYKFRGNEAYGPLMARMTGWAAKVMIRELQGIGNLGTHREINNLGTLSTYYSSILKGLPVQNFRFDAVTYVPVSSDRMAERGFNQAEQLAFGVGAACRVPVLPLLERTCHTEKQSLKSRRERLHDLEGVYGSAPDAAERLNSAIWNVQMNPPFEPISVPIRMVLVDDVYTTGSTVNACSKVLHQVCTMLGFQAEVYIITWARS